jgi:hypothetical protein
MGFGRAIARSAADFFKPMIDSQNAFPREFTPNIEKLNIRAAKRTLIISKKTTDDAF